MGDKYCSFIGQRPLSYSWGYDEENDTFLYIRGIIKNKMTELIKSGIKSFISDMSLGISIVCAEIALELRDEVDSNVRLVCVMPYEKQADKWSSEQRERYFNILAQSSKAIVFQNSYTHDCFMKCHKWMFDYSVHIIAVYNNMPNTSTAIQVEYAKKNNIPLSLINPDTLEASEIIFDKNRILVKV